MALTSPPEPLSTGLVQGSPDDGDFCSLELFQLNSDGIQISDGLGVLSGAFGHSSRKVEVSVIGVESACSEVASRWRKPVPEECHDSFFLGLIEIPIHAFVNSSVVIGLPIEPGVVWRVVLHIETSD